MSLDAGDNRWHIFVYGVLALSQHEHFSWIFKSGEVVSQSVHAWLPSSVLVYSCSQVISPMSSDEKQPEVPKKPPDKPTLHSFIEDNHKLITVLGVFTALTMFAANLTLKPMGLFLSFLFMTLTLILWLELLGRFPSKGAGWRVDWFESILSLTVLVFLVYWLLDFRTIWKNVLIILVFGLVLQGVSAVMRRLNAFNRIFHAKPGEKSTLRYVVSLVLIVASVALAFGVAALVTPWINYWLDAITKSMAAPIP